VWAKIVCAALRLVPVLPSDAIHVRDQRRVSWWLLVARLSAGRTQADAGAALGIKASSYGDYERGVTPPSLKQLRTLAILFEVPLSTLTEPRFTDEERLERDAGKPSQRTQLVVDVDDGEQSQAI
jgi:transcriptional regulator with XRE-family HTH domain